MLNVDKSIMLEKIKNLTFDFDKIFQPALLEADESHSLNEPVSPDFVASIISYYLKSQINCWYECYLLKLLYC